MNQLEEYYNKFNEEKRLNSRHGQVEYRISMEYIHKYIPKDREKSEIKILDIGAGTGSVSVEIACQFPLGVVSAVEMKADALDLIRRNAEKFHALNLRVVPGRAPDALAGLPAPDAVFLGGTTGAAEDIVHVLRRLQRPIRLVATAVTMESAQALVRLMRPMVDFEARQVAVSALESVGRYTMFKAENPVFIFSANVT